MEHGSRTYREQSDLRDDDNNTGGQWDDPSSQDKTGGIGGDSYAPQYVGQSGGDEYGSNNVGGGGGGGGGQTGTGPGSGVDIQSDRYTTPGQYGGPDRATTGQNVGYTDPRTDPRIAGGGGRQPEDDEYGDTAGARDYSTGKPSVTSRVKGAADKLAGKLTGDPGKQARGREREEGIF